MSSTKPVALVSMPTLAAHVPSFQLALLGPTLRKAGYEVETHSLFIHFGKHIGFQLNDTLANVYPSLVGEWIWSKAAFGDFADDAAYVARFGHNIDSICEQGHATREQLLEVRNTKTFEFLDWAVEHIDWASYSCVGFTVVFQQMVASLALARRLKEKFPQLPIIFGGATFEDDIAEQIITHCPFVDVVHCGDGDLSLPELVKRVTNRLPLDGLPGAMFRKNGAVKSNGRAPNLENLDLTPVPDFDEYFHTRAATGHDQFDDKVVMLPIETARGCWYGMKNHCTFCGLNRQGMDFRSKSAGSVVEMLKVLSRRYGVLHFNAIDNIVAPEYSTKLFGALAEGHTDLKLHYEIRPNLSRTQLRSMRLGGLVSVQPGVESFSTHVLTLMKKHTTGIRNVELLKWTTYYGIENAYNILYGFQGETADDYREQARVMRLIPHVQPPWSMSIARPDRGSPMYEEPKQHGIKKLMPAACYPYIYPPTFDLQRVSYFFDDERENVADESAWDECLEVVQKWKTGWFSTQRPTLNYLKSWDSVTIHDRRNGKPKAWRFDDKVAALYEHCSDARRETDLVEKYEDGPWLKPALDELTEKGLMLQLDGKYLALALPQNPNH